MRIIAGEFRGRRLAPPAGSHFRPTADRVREAWFSIIGSAIGEATVLDIGAGSGALGLEAVSRGAAHADFVESASASLRALRANIAALGVEDRVTVHRAEAVRFVEALPECAYDIALADPPYSSGLAVRLIEIFQGHPFARMLAVEHRAQIPVSGGDTRRYGDAALTFCHAP